MCPPHFSRVTELSGNTAVLQTYGSFFKEHESITLLLSENVPNHLGHAEQRIFMLKNAVFFFLLLIVDRCQSDCLLHNQW